MESCGFATCLLLFGLLCFTPAHIEGRQMCLSCAYQSPKQTYLPCVDSPWDWPGGNVRARCNFKCVLEVWKNMKKEEFTYAYRGCSGVNDKRKDGCYEVGDVKYCYFSCEGSDYCNKWNSTIIGLNSANSFHPPSLVLKFLTPVSLLIKWAFV